MDRLLEFITNHPVQVGLFIGLVALFIWNEMRRGGQSVTAQQLVNLMNREKAVVVDLRDPKEFAAGHITGAVNIPHAKLSENIGKLEKYRDRPIVLACRMGQHSGAAGATLKKAGFENVMRLSGGMAEWQTQNLPVVASKTSKSSKTSSK